MISGNYQLLSAAVTPAGQGLEPDCRVVRHFRTRPVVAQSDQCSMLNLEKKATQESDNGRKKVLTMLSALCSSSSSAPIRTERWVEKPIGKKAESKKAKSMKAGAKKVSRKSDKAQVLAQLTFTGDNQSIKKKALSERLVHKAVNDYFGRILRQKTSSPSSDNHERAILLRTMLAKSTSGTRLHRKAAANDLRALEAVIRHAGTDINCQSNKSGITPLLWAAINRHWTMALTLLEAGAYVHLKGFHGQHFLAQVFTARRAQEIPVAQYRQLICTVLLEQAELQLVVGHHAETVFAYVWKNIVAQADVPLLEYLIKAIPSIKAQLKSHQVVERMMIVVIAEISDRPDFVSYLMGLLDSDGNPLINMNHTLDNGDTLLMLAVKCHKRQTVKVLLEDPVVVANINRVNERQGFNYSAYTCAYRDFSFTLMKMLEKKGAVRLRPAIVDGLDKRRAVDCKVCDSRTAKRTTGHTTYYRVPATVSFKCTREKVLK